MREQLATENVEQLIRALHAGEHLARRHPIVGIERFRPRLPRVTLRVIAGQPMDPRDDFGIARMQARGDFPACELFEEIVRVPQGRFGFGGLGDLLNRVNSVVERRHGFLDRRPWQFRPRDRHLEFVAASALPRARLSNHLLLDFGRLGSANFEDVRPVEIDFGVLFFDGTDGVFIERWPPHPHTRRAAVPIEHARPLTWLRDVQQECVFVSAAVARKPQERHDDLLSYLRVAPFFAARFLTGLAGRTAFFAAAFFTGLGADLAGLTAFATFAPFATFVSFASFVTFVVLDASGVRCTIVKRT
jgi:hypothetical protein